MNKKLFFVLVSFLIVLFSGIFFYFNFQIENPPQTISSSWLGNGVPPYGSTCSSGALTQKVINVDFEDLTTLDCENLDYEMSGTIVNEGEIVCWKSENRTYAIIKLVRYYGDSIGQIKYKILNK
jgi:hypothetical protein